MASPVRRSWKLQDFMAHGASVNCLCLGKKSGQVLATGGDDKKVNLWALGKSNCIMSLSGHSTPVECVEFGIGEETLAAGCQSGSIKIWNLAVPMVQRTLNGHKASITSVNFHPYGDYLCSGSLDSFIKLWDLRKKGCIYNYRGHSKSINSLKFSPDGQWIASGGEDGVVRIWDLRAGKRISDLSHHSAPITDVTYHPHEFLLASSAADRTVNFWDLEKFSLVSSTEKCSSTIRCLTFSSGGECLLGGDMEGLKVFGWEPGRQYDSVPMGWGKVQDLVVSGTELIGASYHLTNTSIHVVDLSLVHPLGTPPPQYSSSVPFSHNTSLRKSFTKAKSKTKAKIDVKPIEETGGDEDTGTEEELVATIANPSDYTAIFQPNRSLNRSPLPSTPSLNSDPEDWIQVTPRPPLPPLSQPGDSSTPPLSPVRPARKLSAHRPPSLSLAMMHPSDASSPELELPPKLAGCDVSSNISKLYISSPASRGSSRTASPRRTIPPASPSYSSGSLEAPPSRTRFSYSSSSDPPPLPLPLPTTSAYPPSSSSPLPPKSLERDVDEHAFVTSSFGKPSVDFEVPTKEHEESRIYPTYSPAKPSAFSSFASTKENDFLAGYGDSMLEPSESPTMHEPTRFSSKDSESSRFITKEKDPNFANGNHGNSNGVHLHSNVNSNHGNGAGASRYRDYFRAGHQSSSFPSGSDAPGSMFPTKTSQDSGFSTLDSMNAGSPVGTLGREREREREQIIPMNLSSPVGIDMEQFLPKSYGSPGRNRTPSLSEQELLSTIYNGHEKMMAVLRNRERSLGRVFLAVNGKNVEAGIETAISMNDSTVVVDLLKSMIPRRNIWNLELCSTILPVIQDLLQSKYEMYITTACETLNLILRTFGPVIKNNMKWSGGSSIGVDISKEERYKKCVKVYNALVPVKAVLLKKQNMSGKLGQTFRDILAEVEAIES